MPRPGRPSWNASCRRVVFASGWTRLSGQELLRQAWWRPLPGIVGTGVLFAVLLNIGFGLAIALLSWALSLLVPTLFVRDGTGIRRRPWTET
jgi:hypothetical protein